MRNGLLTSPCAEFIHKAKSVIGLHTEGTYETIFLDTYSRLYVLDTTLVRSNRFSESSSIYSLVEIDYPPYPL